MTPDEIIDAYIDAFEKMDRDAILGLIAPGAVIWHNFDEVDRDIASSLSELHRMKDMLDGMHYELIERFAIKDGIGARLVLRGVRRATGEAFASHQAKFFHIRDGKVFRIEEYVAPPRS